MKFCPTNFSPVDFVPSHSHLHIWWCLQLQQAKAAPHEGWTRGGPHIYTEWQCCACLPCPLEVWRCAWTWFTPLSFIKPVSVTTSECHVNHHHNYSISGSSTIPYTHTYYDGISNFVQVREHQFIKRKVIDLWISLMVISWFVTPMLPYKRYPNLFTAGPPPLTVCISIT